MNLNKIFLTTEPLKEKHVKGIKFLFYTCLITEVILVPIGYILYKINDNINLFYLSIIAFHPLGFLIPTYLLLSIFILTKNIILINSHTIILFMHKIYLFKDTLPDEIDLSKDTIKRWVGYE